MLGSVEYQGESMKRISSSVPFFSFAIKPACSDYATKKATLCHERPVG